MRINYMPGFYAEWHPGARTINLWTDRDFIVNNDCISFGYDKPDNSTTQIEMLDVLMRHIEDVYPVDSGCPACGEAPDYCQGHGEIGDIRGYNILILHDDGNHSRCHPASDCRED